MFKLVVLSALLAVAIAKPHVVATATSYQTRTDIVNKPVIAIQAHHVAAPVVSTYAAVAPVAYTGHVAAYAAPAVHTYAAVQAPVAYAAPAVSYAAVPITGTAYTKTVHYAEKDIVTGYNSQVIKPNLGALATPVETVSKVDVLAPARPVHTITPTVTRVEPEITVQKVQVDVPVHTPVVSEVEVRTPIIKAAPVAVAAYAAAPAVASYGYAAAPAVASYGYASAPAVARYGYAAAPAVASYGYASAPAHASYGYAAAPAVASYGYASAPSVVAGHAYSGYAAPAYSAYAAPAYSHYASSPVAYSAPVAQQW